MISITREPESEEVTKKVTIKSVASSEANVVNGRRSRNTNNAVGMCVVTAETISPPCALNSINRAELPNTLNQRKVKPAGIKSTPRMNSRMVLPREILAMNMPTNGDQDIHQAQ